LSLKNSLLFFPFKEVFSFPSHGLNLEKSDGTYYSASRATCPREWKHPMYSCTFALQMRCWTGVPFKRLCTSATSTNTAPKPKISYSPREHLDTSTLFTDQGRTREGEGTNLEEVSKERFGASVSSDPSQEKREYLRQYKLRNKEKLQEYYKMYRQKAKDKLREYNKMYRLHTKEKRREYNLQYKKENQGKLRDYDKRYKVENKERLGDYQKRYKADKKPELRDYQKKYEELNKEKRQEYLKKYNAENKEKKKEYARKNSEKLRNYGKMYHLKYSERKKLYERKKRGSKSPSPSPSPSSSLSLSPLPCPLSLSPSPSPFSPLAEQKYVLKNLKPRDPNKSWKKPEHVKMFLHFLAEKLHVTKKEDWYRIGVHQVFQLGGKNF
jgi:hypothetical protein